MFKDFWREIIFLFFIFFFGGKNLAIIYVSPLSCLGKVSIRLMWVNSHFKTKLADPRKPHISLGQGLTFQIFEQLFASCLTPPNAS
jgi:hypothetical protein